MCLYVSRFLGPSCRLRMCVRYLCRCAAFGKGPEKKEPREVQTDGREEPSPRLSADRGVCALLFSPGFRSLTVCVGKSHESVCVPAHLFTFVFIDIFFMFRARAIQHTIFT